MIDIQEQVIIGTVLGGSSLVKQARGRNYHLAMRSRDELWLKYKIKELEGFFTSGDLAKQNRTYRCNTSCSPELTQMYHRLYRDGKRYASEELLNNLRDIGLAIWFLEGGGWAGRNCKNAYLNTTMLGDSTELILTYFNNMEIKCSLNKTKNRQKVLFSVKGTEKLLRVIAPKFPPFICDRLK